MTYPLVGLLGVALPLMLGFAPARAHSAHSGFGQHLDTSDEASALAARDESSKLSPVLVKLTPVETDPEHMRLAAALGPSLDAGVAYDVEVTGERLDEWLDFGQLLRFALHLAQALTGAEKQEAARVEAVVKKR